MPTPSPIIVASVGATVDTVVTWLNIRTTDSAEASPRSAVRIGSSIATTVPNVKVRITAAAMIPISSLDSVAGLDTFWPSWPPVSTWIPAACAGLAAALMIVWASSTEIAPGLTDSVTARYPVCWSLLSADAPAEVSGLTTEATSGALATSAADWLTAAAYLESVSFPLLTCRTIGLDPLDWSGNDLLSVSVACWLLVPGRLELSLVLSPS